MAIFQDEINADQEPKIRHNRRVNIHVQVLTSKPEFGSKVDNEKISLGDEGVNIDEGDGDNNKIELDDSLVDYFADGSNISEVCKECLRKKIEKLEYHLMPAHPCDRWDPESSTCWLDRSIGAAVTLSLTYQNADGKMKLPVISWQQEFHLLHKKDRVFFTITPDNLLWNTAISSKGHEFRISPISEADVEPNRFSASVSDAPTPINKVHFKIRLVPIDLGFVYPGETFVVSMDSYISLPIESMAYQWYMEMDTETGMLPSNMKSSPSGSVLTISELRKDQAGILSCNVYTNLGFMVARKRFIIQNMTTENKFLKSPSYSKKSSVISPTKNNKVTAKRFKIRRRDILSKAQKQLEAALWALKYHNAQQDSMENNFENDDPNKPLPSEGRYSNGNNERQTIVGRLYQPARVQQQEIDGRLFGQISPEFQQRLPSRPQMDSGNHYFKTGDRLLRPLNAVGGSRANIGQNPRTRYQNERPRPMQQIIPKAPLQQIMKYLTPQVLQKPETGLNLKNSMQTRLNNQHDYDIYHPDDQISILIAKCQRNAQCSSHAKCVIQSNYKSFCRCLPSYRGNGITCWELSSKLDAPLIE